MKDPYQGLGSPMEADPYADIGSPLDPYDGVGSQVPTQGAIPDALKRVGRSMVDQPGAVVESGGTMLDIMGRALRAYGAGQGAVYQAFLPEHLRAGPENPAEAMTKAFRKPTPGTEIIQDTGRQMRKDAAEGYTGELAPDPARDRTLTGKVADSVGPMAASMATPGGVVAKTVTGALLNSQGAADDAEQQLITEGKSPEDARAEAARQFVLNLPAGALESVGWGKLLGRYGKSLEDAVAEKWGKTVLERILKTTAQQAAIEGGEEALQQTAQNVAAKMTFDPKRKLGAGVADAATVGAIMGGGTAGGMQTGAEIADRLDTTRPKPEVRTADEKVYRTPQEAEGTAAPGMDEMIDQVANEQKARAGQIEKENRERETRQTAARAKREQFDFHLGNAQRIALGVDADGARGVAEVSGSANVLRDYLQDNTLGLTLEQKQAARALLGKLEPIEDRLKAEAETQTQARLVEEKSQREAAESEQKQRIAEERRTLAQQKDIDLVTGKKRLEAMTEDELAEAAHGGNTTALRLLEQRSAGEEEPAEDLLSVLKKVKLPGEDATMGSELTDLKNEWVNFGQRGQIFTGKPGSLDTVAEILRGQYGFTGIETPADVIEFTKRALSGEKIMPTRPGGEQQVDFATAETAAMPTAPTQPKDWRGPEATQYMKDLEEYQTQLAEWTKTAADVLPFRQRDEGTESGVALVSRNMNGGQPWRLTFFKDEKPVGHHEFGSKLDAVRAALAQHSPAPEIEFSRQDEDTVPNEYAGPKLAEIEAKMLRGGVERDTAARAVNRYIDAMEGKPDWKWDVSTSKQITVSEEEARSLNRAVKAYDAGEKFNWPDEDLRKRVMLHFAKSENSQQAAGETATPMDVADFEARLQRIAPGLMMRYKVLVGEPELLNQLGVRPEQLTGREQAAHFPRRKALWFLARNVRAGKDGLMEDRLRRDVLHETTHAWLDSVDDDTEADLRGRWKKDVGSPDGWLATMRKDQVKLRKGVETDWKEYWAERIAQENSQWGARREGAVNGERGFVSQLAYDFRTWLQEAVEYLQTVFTRTKRYNVDFRAFLQDSRFPSPEPAVAGPAGEAASFATEETPQERQAALIRQYNHLTREIEAAATKGNTRRVRGLQGSRSELRAQLDDDFPSWRKEHTEGPDGQRLEKPEQAVNPEPEKDAVPPPEREFATRPGIYSEVEGHTTVRVPWHERTWEKIKETLRGIRGSIPELPAFADDKDQKYSRLRLFNKLIKRGTPRVWKESADQLGTIVKPLLDAGKLDANAYARLGRLQERARKLREENRTMPDGMADEIADLNRAVEREPYGLFQKIAYYLDLKWRVENLKDEQGNAIAQPGGMNVKEINDRIGQLKEQLNTSPHRAAITGALKQHQTLVKEIAADLRARDLTMPEEMQNPFYFPHIVLDKGRDTLERVKLDTQEDFRAYLLRPVGSTKPIETDYAKAMYYHLVAVGSHNLRSDLVKDYVKPYDVMDEVRTRAKELAKQYGRPVSWREAFATEYAKNGYVTFHPDDKLPLHPEMTVDRDTLARRLGVVLTEEPLQQQLEALGLQGIKLLPEDIREALAAGEKETWILPEKVAEALHGMLRRESQTTGNLISTPIQMLQAGWKRNILFAPWNYPRYEFNNTVADLEKLLSADPEIYRLLPKAAREVRLFIEEGKGGKDVHEAFKRGVLDSVTAAEVNDLTALKQFERLQTDKDKITKQVINRFTSALLQPLGAGNRSSLDLSKLREATFRYAKFKADLDRLRNGARPVYAGAYWRDIDAIEDSRKGANDASYQKAAEISLATFGDYHNISVAGQELRRYLIPFYSWMEINFKYHANLFRNLKDMTAASEMSAADAAKAGGRAAAVMAASFTRKAAAGVMLRLALPYLATMLWNNSGDRDELEDGLSAEDKRRFHIILGKDPNGKTRVLYGQTAFADVAKWFGGMDAMRLAGDIAGGRTDFRTALSDWMKQFPRDFANNLFQVGPAVKVAYTAMSGKSSFPDVTDQRTIPANELKWNILGQATDQFTADMIRRAADKDYLAPRDLKDWAQQAILQVRKRDPQQWAFYEIKDKAAQFLEAQTGQTRDSSYNAPDQQVLRNFRRAIYKGDVENAMRFYDRLLEFGYTAERFKASIRAQDPLSALPKDLRDDFVKSLSRFERAQLTRAYEFYTRMTEQRGAERSLFPSGKIPEQRRLKYQPRHERLLEEMQNTEQMTEDQVKLKAEKELHRSLRPSMR